MKERVLGLIQYWADAFRGRPQLGTVEEVYEDLKAQGVEFPPVDLDQLAPVQTPSRVRLGCGGVALLFDDLFLCSNPRLHRPQTRFVASHVIVM